ncbi:helix-turn-helix domain-containing protein [Mycolicibacterium sp. 120270]|uniref:helix-turn-helix domain-containing protein n=1 Tax=Mycolicibacterium sp. 120270 TaxID=3090600 RepID=UPI00299F2206|nr:helix-turn-helix domain-containing protein [Mycolicibacterium sp. 120270]MDX1885361.1 helix-turn-helix domain-containing protein [Mycolicibacterium sp. 120270]
MRGVDPEAYEVLAALHLGALHRSVCGPKVGFPQRNTTKSTVWLTTSEAARQANVTDRSIRRWIAEGRLPATRHGGRWLIHRNALYATKDGQYARRTHHDFHPANAAVHPGVDPEPVSTGRRERQRTVSHRSRRN